MEFILIIVLSIAVFSIWRSSQNAMERLAREVRDIQLDLGFLRDQLAALLRAQAASAAGAKAPPISQPVPAAKPAPVVSQPEPVQAPIPAVKPPEPAAAAHAVTPAIAAFTPAPAHAPAKVPEAVPVPHSPIPAPPPAPEAKPPEMKPPEPKPWLDAIAAQKPPAPSPAAPVAQRPEAMPSAAAEAPKPVPIGRGISSLEQTLGANWLNKIGISCLVIGVGYYLATKFERWGPGGKVLCGYAVSLALLAVGVWLERKASYRIFARGGIGGGWALAFFTTFAMYHLPAAHVLDSLAADLVLMLLVAAGMVGHSLLYRSQTVTGMAFLLGFGTLLTSHLEAANGTLVFSLTASAVLALALVVVTTIRHWAWLELAGLIAVYVSHFVWLTRVLPQDHAAFAEFWASTALILLYWLIFRLAYVLRTPLDQREENISSLSAVFNSIGVLGLLKYQSSHPEWAFWALLALGAVEMGLAFRVRSRRRQAFVVLSTIAVVLLVSAVPFRFHGVTWPVLWLAQAQVLAICGLRLGEPVFRRLGLLAGVVTGGVLAFHDVLPLLFFRLANADPGSHASLTAGLAMAAALYWVHAEVYPRRWPQIAADGREAFALRVTSWLGVAAAATAMWVALPDVWLPVGWLALVLALGFAARWFGATLVGIEADILALCAALLLVFDHVGPLALFRLDYPDPSHHWDETAVLALAALAYWICSEVYPRVFHRLDSDSSSAHYQSPWQATALPMLSWLGAGAAASALWVALPDVWVPVGWVALLLVLAVAAQRLAATPLALEADALAAGSAFWLVFHNIWPLALFRMDNPDPTHHSAQTAVLALAAVAYWLRSEVYPRLLPAVQRKADEDSTSNFDLKGWQSFALPATNWLGLAAAAGALWVALPAPWVVVGWLVLMVALGLAADWVKAGSLAIQADLLTLVAVPGFFLWDYGTQGWWDHRAPLIAAVALLSAGMRRRTVLEGSRNYVAPAYSWAATLLLGFVIAEISSPVIITPIWAVLGLVLFEVGRLAKKGFLRWQGYYLAALALVRYFAIDLTDLFGDFARMKQPALYADHFSFTNSLLLEVLVLAAVGYWLLDRTRNRERCNGAEHIVGLTADALGTVAIALWFAYRFPSYWVPVPGADVWVTSIWAGMATVLQVLAWLMRRRAFQVQAMVLVVAVVTRALFLDLGAETPVGFFYGTLFHTGVTAVILLAALPFAFLLRSGDRFDAPAVTLPPDLGTLFRHPEQWFFFAAFGLEVITLAAKLSSGHITIAWSLLGLGVFLFALAVAERSYRLAGLALLLVCVGKILLVDIWRLPLADRWITFVVLGSALFSISFLYARFGALMRKLL